ncbi:uncharacterized protein LOC131639889 [Vicia villosa]|uniref:uncharacterized protein LOC131639889 n=1 Tax=Vicia villosa TaxID=3911 RepID=UPI00273CADCC|nr:uncharacterized protein LOC131639889 [Vicia villosa]
MDIEVKNSYTWIMKAILDQRTIVKNLENWRDIIGWQKFNICKVYKLFQDCTQKPGWRNMVMGNNARSRAIFILWLVCQDRLATKDRLHIFEMIGDTDCCFCSDEESTNHLFFKCHVTRKIWSEILDWIHFCRNPEDWHEDIKWLTYHTKGKGAKVAVLKMAVTETVYELWNLRNNKVFFARRQMPRI